MSSAIVGCISGRRIEILSPCLVKRHVMCIASNPAHFPNLFTILVFLSLFLNSSSKSSILHPIHITIGDSDSLIKIHSLQEKQERHAAAKNTTSHSSGPSRPANASSLLTDKKSTTPIVAPKSLTFHGP